MANTVAINQTDVSLRIRVLDASGDPFTGLVAATTGHEIWYQRGPDGAVVTDGGSAADLSSVTDAHSDWGFTHIREGWYRVDFPDAAFAEGVGSVVCGMNATNYSGISIEVAIEPLFKFQGNADSVVSTTRTRFPAGTTPLKGDVIMVLNQGTGDPGNQVLVTSTSTEEAVHAAFNTGISGATNLLLIAGDATLADGGINCDTPNSDAATPAEAETACDDAIVNAGLDTISSRIPTALSSAGHMESNIVRVLDIAVTGAGTSADPWGP